MRTYDSRLPRYLHPAKTLRRRYSLDMCIAQIYRISMRKDHPEVVGFDWDVGNRDKHLKHGVMNRRERLFYEVFGSGYAGLGQTVCAIAEISGS